MGLRLIWPHCEVPGSIVLRVTDGCSRTLDILNHGLHAMDVATRAKEVPWVIAKALQVPRRVLADPLTHCIPIFKVPDARLCVPHMFAQPGASQCCQSISLGPTAGTYLRAGPSFLPRTVRNCWTPVRPHLDTAVRGAEACVVQSPNGNTTSDNLLCPLYSKESVGHSVFFAAVVGLLVVRMGRICIWDSSALNSLFAACPRPVVTVKHNGFRMSFLWHIILFSKPAVHIAALRRVGMIVEYTRPSSKGSQAMKP